MEYPLKGLTVNVLVTGRCNFSCGYCFEKCTDISELPENEWISILSKLKEAKVKKVNFSGGEPLLYTGIESLIECSHNFGFITSIVTNGAFLSHGWLTKNVSNLDIIALSLDSGDESIELALRRGHGDYVAQTVRKVKTIREVSKTAGRNIYLKLNVVVNALNKSDDPTSVLIELKPNRVKLLQFCRMDGVNDSSVDELFISKKEFNNYVNRVMPILTKEGIAVVFEDEVSSWASYLVIDQRGRFCDKREGINRLGLPLVDNSLSVALSSIYTDEAILSLRKAMSNRGGLYSIN